MQAEIKAQQAISQAQKLIQARTTERLVERFEHTEGMKINDEAAKVREWIMDEPEARDAQAFEAGMDANEGSPRKAYGI